MRETVILTVKLFVITAVVAVLLGVVNMVTEPIIATNNEKTFQDNMKELLPAADEFDLDGTKLPPENEGGVKVGDVYCGLKSDGEVIGYVTSAVCSEGYGGDIEVMVGITSDDGKAKVAKAKVTAMSETPGLGAKSQSEWIDQYDGLGSKIEVDKNGSAANAEYKVDAISGATITSKAVTKAVNAALDAVQAVIDDNSGATIDEPMVFDIDEAALAEAGLSIDENGVIVDEDGNPVDAEAIAEIISSVQPEDADAEPAQTEMPEGGEAE